MNLNFYSKNFNVKNIDLLNLKYYFTDDIDDNCLYMLPWLASFFICQFLLENNDIIKDKIILDYGCGSGLTSVFAKKNGAKEVFAYDKNLYSIKMSNANSQLNNCSIQTINKFSLENYYDIILCSDVLVYHGVLDAIKKYKNKHNNTKIFFSDFDRKDTNKKNLSLIKEYKNTEKDLSGPFYDTCKIYYLE